jgi:leucyl/phenylalanyl-tRNA---protein transferase
MVPLRFTPRGLLVAYSQGIFPMWHEDVEEIWWYQPDPRAVVPLEGFHISRSLAKTMRSKVFEIRIDTDFRAVMEGCADREEGTWISREFYEVYGELHRMGHAHSVETWRDGKLVGGTYGVQIGGAFMAESMFHHETDASKVALAALVERMKCRRFELLDVQYLTPHLTSLGAVEIPHHEYYRRLQHAIRLQSVFL